LARRNNPIQTVGLALVVLVGGVFYVIQKVVDSVGGITFVMLLVSLIGGAIFFTWYNKKKRFESLCQKYGSPEIARAIMSRRFWQGQTAPQLADSLGYPLGVDRKILKEKSRETWKYDQRGKNRYGLRITLEDGIVVGWDQKG
jgi:hypothetical protein